MALSSLEAPTIVFDASHDRCFIFFHFCSVFVNSFNMSVSHGFNKSIAFNPIHCCRWWQVSVECVTRWKLEFCQLIISPQSGKKRWQIRKVLKKINAAQLACTDEKSDACGEPNVDNRPDWPKERMPGCEQLLEGNTHCFYIIQYFTMVINRQNFLPNDDYSELNDACCGSTGSPFQNK